MLTGPAETEGVARLAELWPNLRAGFDWACATGDRGLADALVRPIVGEVNLRQQTEISDWAERILALTPPADKDDVAFWLLCITYRCKQSGDHDRYERLVHRYGDPDHPLVRYARAYIYDDGEGSEVRARRRGLAPRPRPGLPGRAGGDRRRGSGFDEDRATSPSSTTSSRPWRPAIAPRVRRPCCTWR